MDSYTNAERLRLLCAARDKAIEAKERAVRAVQEEIDRQQGKRATATTGVQSHSYSVLVTYNPAVQSPQKALTVMRDAELRKIRSEFERQRQLTILQARVMSQWQDI